MLPLQFAYFFGACLFLIPWIIIFTQRKDLRVLLIRIGLLLIPLGLIAEYFWWTKDWWKPITITGTVIGIEDFILSFATGGVASCIYLFVFRKKFKTRDKRIALKKIVQLLLVIIFILILFSILFGIGFNSFAATLITMSAASFLLLLNKTQLILPALLSGLLMTLLVIPIFLTVISLCPDVVTKTWMTENLFGMYPFGIPIEDCVFYFLSGVFCFSIYPFLKDYQRLNSTE